VKCLDDWSSWTSEDELLLETCTLSSSEDITVYSYKPFEVLFTNSYEVNLEISVADE
jgi:hypothetical protein